MARGRYDSSRVEFMYKGYDAVLASTIKATARSGTHL